MKQLETTLPAIKLVKLFNQLNGLMIFNSVIDRLSLTPRGNDAVTAQARQMLGQSGLIEFYNALKFAHAALPLMQAAQDHKPVCVSKAFKKSCSSLRLGFKLVCYYIHRC